MLKSRYAYSLVDLGAGFGAESFALGLDFLSLAGEIALDSGGDAGGIIYAASDSGQWRAAHGIYALPCSAQASGHHQPGKSRNQRHLQRRYHRTIARYVRDLPL